MKNAKKLTASCFSGIKSFRDDYPQAKGLVLYRGEESFVRDDVRVMPFERFLKGLIPGKCILEEK